MLYEVITTETASLKLCSASEINARLPDIIPPMISATVMRTFKITVIRSLIPVEEFECLWIIKN